MKPVIINLFTLLSLSLLTNFNLKAQAPQKISYQSVIRNISGNLVSNSTVGVRISILQGSISGTAVFVETHTPVTNANGLATIEIGSVNALSIDWTVGPYFIKVETDPSGGSSYSITGTSQLLSVPYALYSETSGSSIPGPAGNGVNSTSDNGDGTFTIYYTDGTSFTSGDLTGPQGDPGVSVSNIQNTSLNFTTSISSAVRNSYVLSTETLTIPENGYYLIIYTGRGDNSSVVTGIGVNYDFNGLTGLVNLNQPSTFINNQWVYTFSPYHYAHPTFNNVYDNIPASHSLSVITYALAGDQITIGTIVNAPAPEPTASWSVNPMRLEAIKLRD